MGNWGLFLKVLVLAFVLRWGKAVYVGCRDRPVIEAFSGLNFANKAGFQTPISKSLLLLSSLLFFLFIAQPLSLLLPPSVILSLPPSPPPFLPPSLLFFVFKVEARRSLSLSPL